MSVVIETTIGDITVDLFLEERPVTCQNFLKLCKIKYYNFCSFHFVQRDFIAQTGDPTNSGTGGESVFARVHGPKGRFIELEKKPKIKHDQFGLISMVNNGENLQGSQFFFTLCHSLEYLDDVHTVFGRVVEGQDVLVKLNDTICDLNNRPYQEIMITHTVILDDPLPAIQGLELPECSPMYQLEDLLKSDRIGIGEDIVDEDKPPEIIEEEMKDNEAKQRALVLEMIGDIPDAEIAPPENVLFVCKLNPVTREEDLEIIFSRFGKIVSCEIIKDDKTNESLQYGFIEFDCKEDCEKAYFKMDNVLIDDRRIHVDFSQSVSKLKWRGKGRGVTYLNDNNEEESSKTSKYKTMNYIKSMKSNDSRQRNFTKYSHNSYEEDNYPKRKKFSAERSEQRHTIRNPDRNKEVHQQRRDRSRSRDKYTTRRGHSDSVEHHKSSKRSKDSSYRKNDKHDHYSHTRSSSKHYESNHHKSSKYRHRSDR